MADLLSLFRSNIGNVRARRKKIQDDLEQARRRREELRTTPLPDEEICNILMAHLDRRAAAYEGDLAQRVRGFAHDFIKYGVSSPGLQQAGILSTNLYAISGAELEACLAYVARDQVRANLLKTIKGLGLKSGAPRAERAAQLEQSEARIKDLEAQDAEIATEIEALRREIDV
jgi:hypothetical protein